jgi:bile acid:Na+ symporter, BASS family
VVLLVLKATIGVLIFAIGMTVTMSDVAYVWRRPVLLAKSLFAMYVVVPLVAVLMARGLDLPWGTGVALVVLGVCAGAPLLPKKLIKLGGNPTYILSLVVTTSILAIITVPAGLALLSGFVSFEATVVPSEVAATILKALLMPLGAGMLVRAVLPGFTERFGEPLLQWASVALGLCAVVLLVAGFRLVIDVGIPSLLAFAAFSLAALVAGHVLGGPDPGDRTALAVACASRHVGLALLIAANYRGQRTLELVAGYLVASAIVSLPYLRWRSKVLSHGAREA